MEKSGKKEVKTAKGGKTNFYKVLLVVIIILFINSGLIFYKYGDFEKPLTGFSIKETISKANQEIPPVSKIFLITQYFCLALVLFLARPKPRGQAAMEFLMTYGWAIIAVVIIISVLAYFGVFTPGKYATGAAVVSNPFYANAWNIQETGITLEIKNNGKENYAIQNINIKKCGIKKSAITINPEKLKTIFIPCNLSSYRTFRGEIIITYRKPGSLVNLTSTGTITSRVKKGGTLGSCEGICIEDCETPGDEDGNGLADCEDTLACPEDDPCGTELLGICSERVCEIPIKDCFNNTLNPIPICTCNDLDRIREYPNANYKLQNNVSCFETNPINLPNLTSNWSDGKGFLPISFFDGSLDGNGFIIDSLFIRRIHDTSGGIGGLMSGIGLFNRLGDNSDIRNLGLKNVNISGDTKVGALAGISSGTITNSYVEGDVSADLPYMDPIFEPIVPHTAGGLVGVNTGAQIGKENGTIINSYVTGTIKNGAGLVGSNYGSIEDSYANVDIENGWGFTGDNTGEIKNSYANVNITYLTYEDSTYGSGFVGSNDGGIINSYTIADINCITAGITDPNTLLGGLVADNDGDIISSHADINIDCGGIKTVGGLAGTNDEDAKVIDSYATGKLTGGALFGAVGGLIGYQSGGNITNLNASVDVNGTGSICIGGLVGNTGGWPLTNIINSYAEGNVEGSGGGQTGGLAGCADNIINSSASGNVKGSRPTGGLAGNALNIIDSHATGNVEGSRDVGGLAGEVFKNITRSYATGNVIASVAGGGLVGYFNGANTKIIDSYATGNVQSMGISGPTGSERIGGLVGHLSSAEIINSYATGDISEVRTDVGGLAGLISGIPESEDPNQRIPKITNSFSTGKISGGSNVGGIAGRYIEYSGSRKANITNSYWYNHSGDTTNCMSNNAEYTGTCYQAERINDFYDRTYDVYDTNNPFWDFISIWREKVSDYPTLR